MVVGMQGDVRSTDSRLSHPRWDSPPCGSRVAIQDAAAAPLELDIGAVRSLLADQMSDLMHLSLTRTDPGWDNAMWRLGPDLAVRIPQFADAAEKIQREIAWMPRLAGRLTLPVPVPVRTGDPTSELSWPWYVTTWVSGEPANRSRVSKESGSGAILGRFLRALHSPAPPEAPKSSTRGVPLGDVDHVFRQRLCEASGQVDVEAISHLWSDARAAPATTVRACWLHGDLHPANVVLNRGSICGVLDFGELCQGDRAADLAAAWVLLPLSLHDSFFDAYGEVDAPTMRRARGWAALTALGLVAIGQAGAEGRLGGKRSWLECGHRTVEALLRSEPC